MLVVVYARMLLGCATYDSPFSKLRTKVCPSAERATRPLPVTSELPQCARLNLEEMVGVTERLDPVQANRVALCANFQS